MVEQPISSEQLEQMSRQIQQQQESLRRQREGIEKLEPRITQTRAELTKATPASQARIRTTELKREQQKAAAIEEAEKAEQQYAQQVAPVKESIREAQEWKEAEYLVKTPYWIYAEGGVKEKITQILKGAGGEQMPIEQFKAKITTLPAKVQARLLEKQYGVAPADTITKTYEIPILNPNEYFTWYGGTQNAILVTKPGVRIEQATLAAQQTTIKPQYILKESEIKSLPAGIRAEIWLEKHLPGRGAKVELPYYLEQKPEEVYGLKYNPWYTHMYLGQEIDQWLGITESSKGTAALAAAAGMPITAAISNIFAAPAPSWVVATVAETPKFMFFKPAIKTGEYQQAEQETIIKFARKQKGLPALEETTKKYEQIFARQGQEAAQKAAKEDMAAALKEIAKIKDPELQKEALSTLNQMYQRLVNLNIAKPIIITPEFKITVPKIIEVQPYVQPLKPEFQLMIPQANVGKAQWPIFNILTGQMEQPKQTEVTALFQIPKTIPKEEGGLSTKSLSKLMSMSSSALQTTQAAMTIQVPVLETVAQQVTRQVSISPTLQPKPFIDIEKIEKPALFGKPKEELPSDIGYKLFVKRKKKYMPVAGLFSKGEAIKKGEAIALGTLAATFKIMPTAARIPITERAPAQLPSPRVFRGYKIVKGMRVPMQNEWIQKRGMRLASRGERREIQMFKKTQKGGRLKWF